MIDFIHLGDSSRRECLQKAEDLFVQEDFRRELLGIRAFYSHAPVRKFVDGLLANEGLKVVEAMPRGVKLEFDSKIFYVRAGDIQEVGHFVALFQRVILDLIAGKVQIANKGRHSEVSIYDSSRRKKAVRFANVRKSLNKGERWLTYLEGELQLATYARYFCRDNGIPKSDILIHGHQSVLIEKPRGAAEGFFPRYEEDVSCTAQAVEQDRLPEIQINPYLEGRVSIEDLVLDSQSEDAQNCLGILLRSLEKAGFDVDDRYFNKKSLRAAHSAFLRCMFGTAKTESGMNHVMIDMNPKNALYSPVDRNIVLIDLTCAILKK